MRRSNLKKSFAALGIVAMLMSVMATPAASSSAISLVAQDTGMVMPKFGIYALNTNNTIFVLSPGSTSFSRLGRVSGVNGNLIGLDFRPADRKLYAVTDTGFIYTINVSPTRLGAATQVSRMSPRYPGGVQSLMDFNPVLNAVRLIGSDRSNYAVVNSDGNLNATAVQTALSYNPNDVNKGKIPHISSGAYNNNFAGATVTLFYAIDYDLDTFVTIPPAAPGGSSATGGGVLQTIGRLVTPAGAAVNMSSTADFDIVTIAGINIIVGINGTTLFTIDMSKINPSQPVGTTQNVVVRGVTLSDTSGSLIDIAVPTIPPLS